MPSGKMSKVRTIDVEKQNYAPAVNVSETKAGLQLRRIKGNYLKVNQLDFADAEWQDCGTVTNLNKMKVSQPDDAATLRGANNYGERLETYIIKGERGSGCICLNGAAARKVQVGDTVIIIAYALMDFEEAKTFKPTVVFPKEGNKV